MKITMPPLHPAQQQVRQSKARFKVLACGRRFGKTRLASALMTEAALLGGVAWVVTPSYSTGGPCFDDLRRLAAQIPGCDILRGDRLIRYPGGGVCQVRSGEDPSLLRGNSLDLVFFDEAGYQAHLQETWLEVVRPALADRKGGALFASTPNGRNAFWHLFNHAMYDGGDEWQAWQLPTTANPYIDPAEIEAARRQLTERQFAQEFLAEFTDNDSVFRNVRELATAHPQQGPVPGHKITIGVDWGRSADYTVICVYDATAKQVVALDRFTGIEFNQMLGRVSAIIDRWKPAITTCELNSFGQPLFESLQRMNLRTKLHGFNTTNQSKSTLVDCLALALERREITLLADNILINELMAFEATTLASGATRYAAPVGGHDDIVIALLLAYGPNSETAPVELRPQVVAPFVQGKAKGW